MSKVDIGQLAPQSEVTSEATSEEPVEDTPASEATSETDDAEVNSK